MAGELIGLTGLRGAGHELLGRALAGILPCAGGEIRIHGRRVLLASPRHAITAGVAFITSNREEESLAPSLTVRENLFLNPFQWADGCSVSCYRSRKGGRPARSFDNSMCGPPIPSG